MEPFVRGVFRKLPILFYFLKLRNPKYDAVILKTRFERHLIESSIDFCKPHQNFEDILEILMKLKSL